MSYIKTLVRDQMGIWNWAANGILIDQKERDIICRAAEWELRHLLGKRGVETIQGPAQLIGVDDRGQFFHHSLSPFDSFTGVFLAYDIGIYD